jgi:hypothetical protein
VQVVFEILPRLSIKEDEMSGNAYTILENLKIRDHLEDIGVDGIII